MNSRNLILVIIGATLGLTGCEPKQAQTDGHVLIVTDKGKSIRLGGIEVLLIEKQQVTDFLQRKQAPVELEIATRRQELAAATEGVNKAKADLNSVTVDGPYLTNTDYVSAKAMRDQAKARRDSLVAEFPALKQSVDSARVKALALEKQAKKQTTDQVLAAEVIYARTDLQNAQDQLADSHRQAALLKDTIESSQAKMDAIAGSANNTVATELEVAKNRLRTARMQSKTYPSAETYLSDFSPVVAQRADTGIDGKFSFSYPRDKTFTIFVTASQPDFAEKYVWLIDAPTNTGINNVLLNDNDLVYADPDGYFKIKPKKQHTGQ